MTEHLKARRCCGNCHYFEAPDLGKVSKTGGHNSNVTGKCLVDPPIVFPVPAQTGKVATADGTPKVTMLAGTMERPVDSSRGPCRHHLYPNEMDSYEDEDD